MIAGSCRAAFSSLSVPQVDPVSTLVQRAVVRTEATGLWFLIFDRLAALMDCSRVCISSAHGIPVFECGPVSQRQACGSMMPQALSPKLWHATERVGLFCAVLHCDNLHRMTPQCVSLNMVSSLHGLMCLVSAPMACVVMCDESRAFSALAAKLRIHLLTFPGPWGWSQNPALLSTATRRPRTLHCCVISS